MTGFADTAIESQRVFRAIMEAMARPTTVQPLATDVCPPAPLSAELAAVALTLADNDVTLWLDAPLRACAEVAHYLRFHTGAALVDDPAMADFALVSAPENCPPLAAFRQVEPQLPDQSTTIVLQAAQLDPTDGAMRFAGPGIAADADGRFGATPLPAGFDQQIALNRSIFPLGVDLVFVAPGAVSALPRSSVQRN